MLHPYAALLQISATLLRFPLNSSGIEGDGEEKQGGGV